MLGKLPTFAYLYAINIGPDLKCAFCDLGPDSIGHFFDLCPLSLECWSLVADILGINKRYFSNLCNGFWLLDSVSQVANIFSSNALIACCCWAIWKARCNLIYRKELSNSRSIVNYACKIAWEFASPDPHSSLGFYREVSLHSYHPFLKLYTDASWSSSNSRAGLGFVLLDSPSTIISAGWFNSILESPLSAEVEALKMALQCCKNSNLLPSVCFTDCHCMIQLIDCPNNFIAWRMMSSILCIKDLLTSFSSPAVLLIDREANGIADYLASLAIRNPFPSLFIRGLERPHWIDDLASRFGLQF